MKLLSAIWQRGVTLFEMMLVIIIISLIMISIVQYADYQRDQAIAQQFGTSLYTYGQAVRSYLLDNQALIGAVPNQGVISGQSADPGTCTYTFTGLDWLKNHPTEGGTAANPNPNPAADPYLADNFTFNTGFLPLYVSPTSGGADALIKTTVGFKPDASGSICDPTTALNVQVTIPILYKTARGAVMPMPDVTVAANLFANQYYSAIGGGAAFHYTYTVPTGSPSSPGGSIFMNTNIVGVLTSVAEQENYLRVDGQNYMKESVVMFGPGNDAQAFQAATNPNIRNLVGVQNIFFDTAVAHGPTGITGIDSILFDNTANGQPKTIEGLDSIKFITADSTSINDLDTIEFTSVGSTITQLQSIIFVDPATVPDTTIGLSAIGNLNTLSLTGPGDGVADNEPEIDFYSGDGHIIAVKQIVFTGSNSTLEGVGTIIFQSGDQIAQLLIQDGLQDGATNAYTTTGDGGNVSLIPVGKGFCYLTRVKVPQTPDSTQNPPNCYVTPYANEAATIFDYNWHLIQDNGGGCTAMCLQWMP